MGKLRTCSKKVSHIYIYFPVKYFSGNFALCLQFDERKKEGHLRDTFQVMIPVVLRLYQGSGRCLDKGLFTAGQVKRASPV